MKAYRNWKQGLLTAVAFGLLSSFAAAAIADEVTEANVADRIAAAKTAEDHEAIAKFFRSEAAVAGATVKRHQSMVASWEQVVGGNSLVQMRRHCEGNIEAAKKMQKNYQAFAEEQEKLAKAAGAK